MTVLLPDPVGPTSAKKSTSAKSISVAFRYVPKPSSSNRSGRTLRRPPVSPSWRPCWLGRATGPVWRTVPTLALVPPHVSILAIAARRASDVAPRADRHTDGALNEVQADSLHR